MDNIVIYDVETFKHCFILCLKDLKTNKVVTYEISEYKDDYNIIIKLLNSLISRDYYFVGYNNLKFDAQILNYILDGNKDTKKIHRFANNIINSSYSPGEHKLLTKNIDLFLIKGFDSLAKKTSLKFLEFNFQMKDIKNIPIDIEKRLTKNEIKILRDYCKHDIEATHIAYDEFKSEVISRIETGKLFNLNLTNVAEPKMVKKIFVSKLSEILDVDDEYLRDIKYEYVESLGLFTPKLPSYLDFKDQRLIDTHEFYKNLLIDKNKTKKVVDLKYKWNDISIVHGLGGLHGCADTGVYEENDDYIIEDLDFTSYYPFILITNNLYPPYLGESFINIYKSFYDERKKHKKGTPLNYSFKILLNSTYGLLNESNSPIYYPEGALSITIIGQLTLLMLAEKLKEVCNDIEFLQFNTDGVTIRYRRECKDIIKNTYEDFSKLVNISIESVFYKKMIIRDVNNYMSIDENNKVKRKGCYEPLEDFKKTGLWNKNSSFNIIPLALTEYYLNNTPVIDYVINHNNRLDFCAAVKVKSDFEIELYDDTESIIYDDRVLRYIITNDGKTIRKKYKDGRLISIVKGYLVNECNNFEDNYNINYDYYIKEINKLII